MADAAKNEAAIPSIRELGHVRNHPEVAIEIEKLEKIRQEIRRMQKALADVDHSSHTGVQYELARKRIDMDPVERAFSDDDIARMGNAELIRRNDEEQQRFRRKLEDLERAEPVQSQRVERIAEKVARRIFASELSHEVIGPAEKIEHALRDIEDACSELDKLFDELKPLGFMEVWPEMRFPVAQQKYRAYRPSMPGKFEFQIKAWREQYQRVKELAEAAN